MEIGIAAIDCGADAVYIAGPGFGARKAAGNSIEDIRALCSYAHRFGARIFLTVNTIFYDSELEEVHSLMLCAQDAGVDAFIVQDLALTGFSDITVPLHASTQCAIRTPEKARFLESLGFSRLVLERELSLRQIEEIIAAVGCEVECFVHGALCVCYSGECYLSEALCGRSANRGECVQACRSQYDLVDEDGSVILKNRAALSLKDLRVGEGISRMADAGVCSFKIEGRLKNISYVRNVVREYSLLLDRFIAERPGEYARASFGKVSKGFDSDADRTFNRGYTSLFLDGERGKWASMDTPKGVGERIGTIEAVRRLDGGNVELTLRLFRSDTVLSNGDGFCIADGGAIKGFRADVCEGRRIRCKSLPALRKGAVVYRNVSAAFERELERQKCVREIGVALSVRISGKFEIDIIARSEDGREVFSPFKADVEVAENRERAEEMFRQQLSKRSGIYNFRVESLDSSGGPLPLMSAATLNSMRRLVSEDLDAIPCRRVPLPVGRRDAGVPFPQEASYKANLSNAAARRIVSERGAAALEDAFELTHLSGAELMRTKYCLRYEMGLCPVHQGAPAPKKLFLENNGRRFALGFDCAACEMTLKECL